MPSQFASDFMLDLGGVVGYINQIQRKIWGEVGLHIAGMNWGTRSSTAYIAGSQVFLNSSCQLILYHIFSARSAFARSAFN